MTFSLLLSCVALLRVGEHFALAAPSSTDDYGLTEATFDRSEPGLRTGASAQQSGCPCSDNTPKQSDRFKHSLAEHFDTRNMMVHGMMCMCNVPTRNGPTRDDYQYSAGIGSHKLHTRVASWNEARKTCNEEGGHLAIINSLAEERVLIDIFNRSGPFRGASTQDEAYIGLHDLYYEGDWVTVSGDSLAKTGFTKWSQRWGGQPDNGGGIQHCGALVNDGGMDDVACSILLPFFCELPAIQLMH